MEGLLASRLGDQDAPRKLQDRGVHGTKYSDGVVRYFTGGEYDEEDGKKGLNSIEIGPPDKRFKSKQFTPEQSTEATNYIKAVDRYHNRDDWDKDLGGGTSFLQGPTGDSEGYVDPLMRIGAARKKLLADPENELDRNEMDSETLDYFQQDQGSDLTERLDELDTESLGPDHMDQRGESVDETAGRPFGGLRDAMSGLLSSDDEEKEKKKKKGLSKSEKAGYAEIGKLLTDKSGTAQDMRPPAPPALSIKQGQVAFPGLLAQKAPVQQRYTPRGLV